MRITFSKVIATVVACVQLSAAAHIYSTSSFPSRTASPGHSLVTHGNYKMITGTAYVHAASVHSAVIKPTTGPSPDFSGDMTLNITNMHTASLSIAYTSDPSAPSASGDPQPAPLGDTTQILLPSGFTGVVGVGPELDSAGSKIETSYGTSVYADVSYVDGYTVPITCSCDNERVSMGCNIELFNATQACPDEDDGPICYNPAALDVQGPAHPFFAPCEGAAYTYPADDMATRGCKSGLLNCCVGAECPANPNQLDQKLKRFSGRVTGRRN